MNRFLLDTSVLIEWAIDPKRLRDQARLAIADGRSHVFVSAVSAWEIAIKTTLGKFKAPGTVAELLQANRFLELVVTVRHAEYTAHLPMLHRDPFDRLLVAQARSENLTLITHDEAVRHYDVPTLAA